MKIKCDYICLGFFFLCKENLIIKIPVRKKQVFKNNNKKLCVDGILKSFNPNLIFFSP